MVRDVEKKIVAAIEGSLLRAGARRGSSILVGLSGGADSVALTCAMLELRDHLGLRIAAAHLNHRIRGAESDRDEAFVRRMCARLGVDLIVERANDLDVSTSTANLEERARDARREFLLRVADRVPADFVALGHHRDDQAETVMMRLMRGSGATGLSAMAERGPGRLIRPMLSLSRAEIRDYLDVRAIPFVEDSSNSSRDILRNRIRVELLPMLEREYTPGLSGRLVELASEMRSLHELVATIAARELDAMRAHGDALDVSGFDTVNRAVQAVVIRLFLAERMGSLRRISRAHVESVLHLILEGGPSDSIVLPAGWRAQRKYSLLRLVNPRERKTDDIAFSVPIALDGVTIVEAARFQFESSTIAAADAPMPDTLSVAMFDASKIADTGLIARNFVDGDRIHPLGMRGTRKVHDVFVDRKLPRASRERFPIIMLGGEIAWLPGLARAECARVTNSTETILRVEASEIAA